MGHVVIAGATGVVGSAAVEAFAAVGWRVTAICRRAPPPPSREPRAPRSAARGALPAPLRRRGQPKQPRQRRGQRDQVTSSRISHRPRTASRPSPAGLMASAIQSCASRSVVRL